MKERHFIIPWREKLQLCQIQSSRAGEVAFLGVVDTTPVFNSDSRLQSEIVRNWYFYSVQDKPWAVILYHEIVIWKQSHFHLTIVGRFFPRNIEVENVPSRQRKRSSCCLSEMLSFLNCRVSWWEENVRQNVAAEITSFEIISFVLKSEEGNLLSPFGMKLLVNCNSCVPGIMKLNPRCVTKKENLSLREGILGEYMLDFLRENNYAVVKSRTNWVHTSDVACSMVSSN